MAASERAPVLLNSFLTLPCRVQGRCAHVCAAVLHVMMQVNPEIMCKWYNKNADGIPRPTIADSARRLAAYTSVPFESPVAARKRAALEAHVARIDAKRARNGQET